MKILLHVCCGPCAVYPLSVLRREGMEVSGYFFNPNIHPYQEFKQRIRALENLSVQVDFPVKIHREYGLRLFLRKAVFHETDRCSICYGIRLAAAAEYAAAVRADAFTTTLLYSRYQNHDLIRRQAETMGNQHGVPFYYRDFREGWQEGIDGAIAMGLYRQAYCGCIYSEQERFDKNWRKRRKEYMP